ncbi:ATP-binding cassette domain-containing protein [Haloferax sp. MBLA0078]|uniref:ATP-binding cassette domain-containing protein n=2 Tax=Haloferacaceae TaxID=1644056 RepID=A0A6A8GBS4_9EURY|nr:ATP-binding cassette domain-containing protein [Haloferax marinum]KAB1190675.1 ATP-binding cassette domain-containing protein [Haloferax sp. CBA1150]MRW98205.1 ATP-binding cassette domain-containing protein [Haloferax marinum]
MLDKEPGKLSGGQRQRVAIDRTIIRELRVFFFHEPSSNLDVTHLFDIDNGRSFRTPGVSDERSTIRTPPATE